MTGVVEIFVGLLLAVAVLALLARKLHIPYPILFVIGGLLLGLIPKLPIVRLDPELVFLFFLPPLLFPAALFTSWRDFRANLRPISLLAIGLVLFTTITVALLAHHFMDLPLDAGLGGDQPVVRLDDIVGDRRRGLLRVHCGQVNGGSERSPEEDQPKKHDDDDREQLGRRERRECVDGVAH